MEMFNIYLSGACKHLDEKDQNVWRESAKDYFSQIVCTHSKINAINPNDYFNYFNSTFKNDKQIKQHFMWMIRQSKLMLVNLNHSDKSCGTGQELQEAINCKIPIIGFGTENIYPWYEVDCDVVFETEIEALEYIRNYYIL